MMNAKEMFEKLGFDYAFVPMQGLSCAHIFVGKRFDNCIDSYGIIKFEIPYEHIKYDNIFILNPQDIKAIHQQMKELGWL